MYTRVRFHEYVYTISMCKLYVYKTYMKIGLCECVCVRVCVCTASLHDDVCMCTSVRMCVYSHNDDVCIRMCVCVLT